MSEPSKLHAALVAAQSEMKNVPKTALNPHFKNRYATLDSILAMARPVLNKHKLAIVQGVNRVDGQPVLITSFAHESGESCQVSSLPLILDKQNMQSLGSAITYARRYAVGSALGITTDDDDDGNGASQTAGQSASAISIAEDRTINDKELESLKNLIDLAQPNMARFLTAAGAQRLEDIKASKLPVLRAGLERKLPK